MYDLLSEGAQLTIVGMGVVFLLLSLLVVAVGLMSRLAGHIDSRSAFSARPEAQGKTDEAAVTAVITAAVHAYRKDARTFKEAGS